MLNLLFLFLFDNLLCFIKINIVVLFNDICDVRNNLDIAGTFAPKSVTMLYSLFQSVDGKITEKTFGRKFINVWEFV